MWYIAVVLLVGVTDPVLKFAHSQDFQDFCATPDGQDGVCINIKECPALLNILQERGIAARDYLLRSQCGFGRDYPKVCCPSVAGNGDAGSDDVAIRNTTYGPLYPPACGFSDTRHNRIVGGYPAELGAWPWITALGYRNRKNPSTPKWLCGGALISSRHVLTAGHCVYDRKDLYVVRVGDLDLERLDDGAQPYDVLIDRVTLHPEYSSTIYTNDIAVIRLGADVPFSRNLHPICLPASDDARQKSLLRTNPFVAGWGSIYFRGPASNRLQEVQLSVVEPSQCKYAFRNFKNTVIDDRVVCAGKASGGKDACQGDSGGPLMLPRADGTYYIIGVVSYGYKCAEPGFPGVYTKVTSFLDFIVQNLD